MSKQEDDKMEDDMSEQLDDEMVLARDEYEREESTKVEVAGQHDDHDVHMEGDKCTKREESEDLLGNEVVHEEPYEPPPKLVGISKALIRERMQAKKLEQAIVIRGVG